LLRAALILGRRNRAIRAGGDDRAHRLRGMESLNDHPPDDRLLTAEEVAAFMRVTRSWVYAETRRDGLPHVRLGRYVRYRRSAIERWMEGVERGPRAR
jgi:excisionase family DNA binding protein